MRVLARQLWEHASRADKRTSSSPSKDFSVYSTGFCHRRFTQRQQTRTFWPDWRRRDFVFRSWQSWWSDDIFLLCLHATHLKSSSANIHPLTHLKSFSHSTFLIVRDFCAFYCYCMLICMWIFVLLCTLFSTVNEDFLSELTRLNKKNKETAVNSLIVKHFKGIYGLQMICI